MIAQVARTGGGVPCLELFDPDGIAIGSIRCSVSGACIDAPLTKRGQHTIRVSEQFHDQTVPYGIVLERVSPPSPAATPLCFGCSLADEINPLGDLDLYIFSGVAGDTVTALAARESGGVPCIEIFAPDGQHTPKGRQVCSFSGAQIIETVQQDGLHTIVVSEQFNDQTIGYRVDLQCVGQCPELLPCDPNNDGILNFQDVVAVLKFLLRGIPLALSN